MRVLLIAISLLIVLIFGCEQSEPIMNVLPVIHEITYLPENPDHLTSIQLWVKASDADGDLLSYSWQLNSGCALDDLDHVIIQWRPLSIGNQVVTCTVNDGIDTVSGRIVIPVLEARTSMSGLVIEDATDQILAGVSVNVEGRSTQSDSRGYYFVENLPRQVEVVIRASHPGYKQYTEQYFTHSESLVQDIRMQGAISNGPPE